MMAVLAPALPNLPRLKHLSLKNNHITHSGVKHLCTYLPSCRSLMTLNLDDNDEVYGPVPELATALSLMANIETVVGDMIPPWRMARAIFRITQTGSTLTEIKFHREDFRLEDINALVPHFPKLISLRELSFKSELDVVNIFACLRCDRIECNFSDEMAIMLSNGLPHLKALTGFCFKGKSISFC